MNVAVIGSGLTGMACARGLIERGVRVEVLDVGEELDAERQALIAKLRQQSVSDWDAASIAQIRENPHFAARGGVPQRRLFGSDFVFAREREHSPIDLQGTPLTPTFAKGGFSTVWGASVLPVAQRDIEGWPVRRSELEPYYAKLFRDMLPLSADKSCTDPEFPLFTKDADPIPLPSQCAELLDNMRRQHTKLARQGLRFERARLAVRNANSDKGLGCVCCGLCLYGCVPNSIYSAADDVERLKSRAGFEYLSGIAVQAIEEADGHVTVHWRDERGQHGARSYESVFLALGTLNTTRLLMRNLELFGQSATILDSQKFILPLLTFKSSPTALDQRKPVLPGIFADLLDPNLDPYWIHGQIYPTSAPMLARLGLEAAAGHDIRHKILAPVLQRLMLAWIGLHSDHSGHLAVRLDSQTNRLHVKAVTRAETSAHVRMVSRRYFRLGLQFGVLFVTPAKLVAAPGGGSHIGGSFPMRRKPRNQMETDVWGRPTGRRRIFAVDSSVLPSIPATTITLTAMANAWRIGSQAPIVASSS